ncbi:MAG: hypothetical protein AAFQ99_13945 [Pseudomonadota bacterium]
MLRELRCPDLCTSGGLVLLITGLVLLLMPGGPAEAKAFPVDKLQHVFLFAGLTGWFCGVLSRRAWLGLALGMGVFACATELAQSAMQSGRVGDPVDFAMDLLGIALAFALARMGMEQWCVWVEGQLA